MKNLRRFILIFFILSILGYSVVAYANLNTELLEAAFDGHTETVKALLAKGTDVNTKNNNGNTALIIAALRGHTETVKALLAKGADVNVKNNDDYTALIFAKLFGHTEIVQALLAKGADMNAKDISQELPRERSNKITSNGLSDQAEKDCLAFYATTKTCAEYGRDVDCDREKCIDFADKIKQQMTQNRPDLDLYMTALMTHCKLMCVDQTPFTLSYSEFKSQYCGHMLSGSAKTETEHINCSQCLAISFEKGSNCEVQWGGNPPSNETKLKACLRCAEEELAACLSECSQ